MNRVPYFGLLAIALAAIGIGMWLFPGISVQLDTLVIALVGVIILMVGYHRYMQARRSERVQAAVGDVEERPPIHTPGDTLDRGWDDYRFEAVATSTVALNMNCTEEEALELLASGEWTDDPVAASYFSRTKPPIRRIPFLEDLLSDRPKRDPRHQAAIELARLADIDGRDENT